MSLPDDYFKGIGRITVNFAHLEFDMSFLIWHLLDSDQKAGLVVAKQMTFKQKYDLIRSLCELRVTDMKGINEFSQLLNNLEQIGKERNRLVHSIWMTDGSAVFSQQRKALLKVTLDSKQPGDINLKQLGDSITEVSRQIDKFVGSLLAKFPNMTRAREGSFTETRNEVLSIAKRAGSKI